MPTVLRIGPYRFFFYVNEGHEPRHIHVERDGLSSKFWLDPIKLARRGKMRSRDLDEIMGLIREHHTHLITSWDEYFSH